VEGIAQTKTRYGGGDHRWMADVHGLSTPEPGTLDGSLFPAGTFADGLVPSGVDLGRVTATKLLGPYDDAATDGRQTAVGHLISDQVVATGSRNDVALYTHGAVIRDRLPANSGHNAAAEADLKHIRYRDF
jgi:Bacteriophage lambda head decoration protein D